MEHERYRYERYPWLKLEDQIVAQHRASLPNQFEKAVEILMNCVMRELQNRCQFSGSSAVIALERTLYQDSFLLAQSVIKQINQTNRWHVIGEPVEISFWEMQNHRSGLNFATPHRPVTFESAYFAFRVTAGPRPAVEPK